MIIRFSTIIVLRNLNKRDGAMVMEFISLASTCMHILST